MEIITNQIEEKISLETSPLIHLTRSDSEVLSRSKGFMELITKRRSVRQFSKRQVSEEIIRNCLKVAGAAPSGANKQPWRFVAVSNSETKREIRQQAEELEIEFYAKKASQVWLNDLKPIGTTSQKGFLEDAPYLIAIFSEQYSVDAEGERAMNYYPSESTGLAVGALITALSYSGLGCLTYTPSPMRFLNEVLSVPRQFRPFMLLVVGYPDSRARTPTLNRKTVDEYVQFRR